MKRIVSLMMGSLIILTSVSQAEIIIHLSATDGKGGEYAVGTVRADDTPYGLLLTPKLHDLPPGIHGFHIHDLPMCSHAGMAAGGHLDPLHTNKHLGPYLGNGHLGDLPILVVDEKGKARLPVLAPRLKLNQIQNHALMIHASGDNYSDYPQKLGGGGERIACGIIGDYH